MVSRKAPAVPSSRAPQWNEDRRRIFLQTLAETSNVAASERAADMAAGSAYRERRKSPAFRAAWQEALSEGYDRLELVLLHRALEGVVKRTTRTETGTETTEYSDRLGMSLLSAHRGSVMAARGQTASAEDPREWLRRKLADMARRKPRED